MATEFSTQVGNGKHCLRFETDNREYYLLMQETARRCVDEKPVTNADRIRSMTDEELAKFIDDIAQSVADAEYCTAFLNVKNFPYSCEDTKKACVAHVVDWLHQLPKGE